LGGRIHALRGRSSTQKDHTFERKGNSIKEDDKGGLSDKIGEENAKRPLSGTRTEKEEAKGPASGPSSKRSFRTENGGKKTTAPTKRKREETRTKQGQL